MQRKQKIAVVPGDGIGKEVIAQGLLILEAFNEIKKLNLEFIIKDWGADKWLNEKIGLPSNALSDLRTNYSAIYFGALGDSRIPDMAHGREILLGLRQGLDLFVNLRPVQLLNQRFNPLKKNEPIDFVVIRENTEDLYNFMGGSFKQGTCDEVAIDESIHTYKGVLRIIEFAFAYAAKNKRKKVTLVDKSNAISFGGSLWQRVFKTEAAKWPEITANHLFVDVAALEMLREPSRYDIIVTSNLFGDILSDLAAGLVGGLGVSASANLDPGKMGLFEPVHGSAPNIAGKNQANPFAAILTAGMLLDFLKVKGAGKLVEKAVQKAVEQDMLTIDLGGNQSTTQVGAFILDEVRRILHNG